jgi:hypothetical protein
MGAQILSCDIIIGWGPVSSAPFIFFFDKAAPFIYSIKIVATVVKQKEKARIPLHV